MKTATTLSILLTGSVLLNVYFWWKSDPMGEECHATAGFEVPVTIPQADAVTFADEYKRSLVDPNVITGGVITRSAFDEMMCLENCNAVTYSFALDAAGGTGPGNRGAFLIVNGANVSYDDAGKMVVNSVGSSYYITRNWCPPSCMPW